MKINKIFLNQEFKTKDDVFNFLGKVAQEIGIVDDKEDYLKALEEREAQISTGLVNGFALPHGKSEFIKRPAVIYIKNQTGIEWGSLDESLTTDIFALAIPTLGDSSHLDVLIKISTQLVDEEVCEKLKQCENEKEIQNLFE